MPRPDPRFAWFVPIDGDGTTIGTEEAERPPTFENLTAVVRSAEDAGFDYLLIPTRFANGLFASDAALAETWTTATGLLAVTERIRLLVAVRPGFVAPGLFAQMAATLANNCGGRIDLNVVPGGIQGDFERFGVTTSHRDRYGAAAEFMDGCSRLWAGSGPVTFEGSTFSLADAMVSPPPPAGSLRWYLGGASDNALALAGQWGDVLLAWIQPLEPTAALLDRARAAYADAGRPPSFGLRTHLVVGETEDDAWRAADALIAGAAPIVLEQRSGAFAGTAAVGQRAQLREGADGGHRITERLWNGISTVRVNCGTAIVGSPDQVADELAAYWRLGMDEFILSAWPHAEQAERVAEQVLPRVRDRLA